jgi:[ribosomal protein S5]-alanine N-acetyltransferase
MPGIHLTPFPTLTTERLNLRQMRDADADALFVVRADPDIVRYVDRAATTSVDEARTFIDRINEGIALRQWIYWAITLQGEDRLIGTICLWDFSDDRTTAEIGYELLPPEQGNGFMHEAVRAVMDYGFAVIGLRSIEAVVHPDNTKSIRLLERNDFAKMGTLTEDDVERLIYVLDAPATL